MEGRRNEQKASKGAHVRLVLANLVDPPRTPRPAFLLESVRSSVSRPPNIPGPGHGVKPVGPLLLVVSRLKLTRARQMLNLTLIMISARNFTRSHYCSIIPSHLPRRNADRLVLKSMVLLPWNSRDLSHMPIESHFLENKRTCECTCNGAD